MHVYLLSCGIENLQVLPVLKSIKRKRRAKTPNAGGPLRIVMRYHGAERRLSSVVRVPAEAEDQRNLNRDLELLKKNRTTGSGGSLSTRGLK